MFKTKKNRQTPKAGVIEKTTTSEYVLPVISLDGDIVGPEIDTYIDLNDTASILAVEEASKISNLICFVNHLSSENCTQDVQLKRVGCIADVKDIIRLGQSTIRLSVKGLKRAIVVSYVSCDPFIQGNVMVFGECGYCNIRRTGSAVVHFKGTVMLNILP
jgi:ATP-dependent Lon protease